MLVVAEVTESRPRVEQAALFPLGPLLHIQSHKTALWVALPWRIPKAPHPAMYVTGLRRQKKWPKRKNRSKLQKKIQLSDEGG